MPGYARTDPHAMTSLNCKNALLDGIARSIVVSVLSDNSAKYHEGLLTDGREQNDELELVRPTYVMKFVVVAEEKVSWS